MLRFTCLSSTSLRGCQMLKQTHMRTLSMLHRPILSKQQRNQSVEQQQQCTFSTTTPTPTPTPAAPPAPTNTHILKAGASSFAAISVLTALHQAGLAMGDLSSIPVLIGSFGATCALVYGAPKLPVSQPRNVIGGHMLSASIAVGCYSLLPLTVAMPMSVSLSVMTMLATKTFHPPAAANGLVYAMGPVSLQAMGMLYPVLPCFIGPAAIVGLGCVTNNIGVKDSKDRYPTKWF